MKKWSGSVPKFDDFGVQIELEFIDGKTIQGPWAIMSPASWKRHGCGKLGLGYGQRYCYEKEGDYWIKMEG